MFRTCILDDRLVNNFGPEVKNTVLTPECHHILGRHARRHPLSPLYLLLRILILVVLFNKAGFPGKLANRARYWSDYLDTHCPLHEEETVSVCW